MALYLPFAMNKANTLFHSLKTTHCTERCYQILEYQISNNIFDFACKSDYFIQVIFSRKLKYCAKTLHYLQRQSSGFHFLIALNLSKSSIPKQPSRGVLRKRCSENMQQIYRRTPTPKCDSN